MDTTITLKLDVSEFDLIRQTFQERVLELEQEIRTTRGVGTIELRRERDRLKSFLAELDGAR